MRVVVKLILWLAVSWACTATAMPGSFGQHSYQKILQQRQQDNFILVLWSLDCPPCIEELPLLAAFHKQHPGVDIVMVSTDDPSRVDEVVSLMQNYQLADINHWVFEANAEQRIRYSIDPQWYGELPRSYFYTAGQRIAARSGQLKQADLDKWLSASNENMQKEKS